MHHLYKSLLPVNCTCSNLLLGNFPAIRQTDYLVIDILNCVRIKYQELASPSKLCHPKQTEGFYCAVNTKTSKRFSRTPLFTKFSQAGE